MQHISPREVLSPTVIAPNHPSGNIEPSQEDVEITRRIKNAGTILGIELLDHIIFTENKYYSFLEEGKI
jgi:DNA repair protein RadC